MKTSLLLLFALFLGPTLNACIQDADTLTQERQKSPNLTRIIFGEITNVTDTVLYRDRIKELQAQPHTNSATWWNDLAGAHLRLGEAKQAAALLETVTNRFPNDYGIHANLGTAYHLMGRYVAAEKEIRRDLEINPDAHSGLEKYHLALLQYLVRDAGYKVRHVFVDEFSISFLQSEQGFFHDGTGIQTNTPSPQQIAQLEKTPFGYASHDSLEVLRELCAMDTSPEYRRRWNLAEDPKFEQGVFYMTSLNPKEPACFVMLGIISANHGDLNLAVAAFEKAIRLGSPQAGVLIYKVQRLREAIRAAQEKR